MGAKIDARLVEMNAGGWDIGFFHQPANSPDCNTLDLAFFRAIQSLQYQKCPKNIDELIAHVHEAFDELPLDICCKVWTTAQIVMNQIILQNGNNDYKLPHIRKLKIEKAVGHNMSMRLPCHALIDGGALDCQYITTFLSNGKFIVVLTASLRRRRHPSSSIASSSLSRPRRCTQRHRRPSAPSPSPSAIAVVVHPTPSAIAVAVAVAAWPSPSSSTSSAPVALSKAASLSSYSACQRTHRRRCLFPLIILTPYFLIVT